MNCNSINQRVDLTLPRNDLRKAHSESLRNHLASEVLIALRDGSHEAYEEVYKHYRKPLRDFIHTLTRSLEVAEDITHDVFISVWESREKLDPAQGIRRYLYAVAKHLVMRYFRQKKNEANYSHYNGQQSMHANASDELLFEKEADTLIEMVSAQMPRLRGQIFEMYYRDGLSYDRIADDLGMNKATVANHLTNARKDIRKVL